MDNSTIGRVNYHHAVNYIRLIQARWELKKETPRTNSRFLALLAIVNGQFLWRYLIWFVELRYIRRC